jgi:hypothetical protein
MTDKPTVHEVLAAVSLLVRAAEAWAREDDILDRPEPLTPDEIAGLANPFHNEVPMLQEQLSADTRELVAHMFMLHLVGPCVPLNRDWRSFLEHYVVMSDEAAAEQNPEWANGAPADWWKRPEL